MVSDLRFQKIILLFPQLSSLKPCLACVVYSLVSGGNGTVNLFERAVYLFKARLQTIVTETYLRHIAVFIGHNITPFQKFRKPLVKLPLSPFLHRINKTAAVYNAVPDAVNYKIMVKVYKVSDRGHMLVAHAVKLAVGYGNSAYSPAAFKISRLEFFGSLAVYSPAHRQGETCEL